MKIIFKLLLILVISKNLLAREIGETEITTEDGVEVYQNEKYYLLKKNVKIISDSFELNADNVKIYFDENLYDIVSLEAEGSTTFNSSQFNIQGSGEKLKFQIKFEKLQVEGAKSKIISDKTKMFSNGSIMINNANGSFSLKGSGSKLINNNILIEAENINGIFHDDLNRKEINSLNVFDEKISYIKNINTEIYAKKINFDKKTSIIELIDDVAIIRNNEKISGDYGTLDTKNNSYKIKSNNQEKVKIIIQSNEQ